ncbi:aminoglycoside phosphotransferase family protein [Streptacidiphilus sp. NEAU-YB345]|uniref:Aminoglycoside phosphotransferase family protein n=2 Tax=Streptacidiphilus fuscans TaxID=2789292 RepID=A0A931B2S2_9ACTN|nr:aminoglycoside phosphotransferase family protein [Streptacidiphilus fuscans]
MHADETEIDLPLVRRLVAEQFPQWAALPVERVDSAGTSNAMFRLGEEMVVRLPRIAGAAADVEKEQHWLRRLAPQLPCAVPAPLGVGTPAHGYPWAWSVYGWLDGVNPTVGQDALPESEQLADDLAADLAAFVTALHRIDPDGGPASYRSEPLSARDQATRRAIADLHELIDADAATAVWEAALRAPEWSGPTVWIHADLQPGNVLVADGRLSAVIDFGCLGLGDPAVDLITAWYVLPRHARPAFRAAVASVSPAEADDAAWARGRGWALSVAVAELRYYQATNPVMATIARHVIAEVSCGDGPW